MDGLTELVRQVPIHVWLGVLGVLVLLISLRGGRRRPRIYTRPETGSRLGRALWRAASGAHMDGELRTNAGWWTRGTKDLTKNEKAPRWAYLPRGVRMLIRWGVLLVAVTWLWGYVTDSSITGVLTIGLVLGLATWAGVKLYRAHRRTRWRTRYLVPIHNALAEDLGWHPKETRPEDWISVPASLGTEYASPIVLLAPKGFVGTPELRYRIGSVVAQAIGASPEDLETLYHDAGGDKPRISFTRLVDHSAEAAKPAPGKGKRDAATS